RTGLSRDSPSMAPPLDSRRESLRRRRSRRRHPLSTRQVMALSRKQRDAMRALCGEIHEDDGIDPRDFFRDGGGSRRKNDYATLRLCAQVRQTLELVLPGALGDAGAGVRVASVTPAPDASRLLASVA